jgi:hypothetical protein
VRYQPANFRLVEGLHTSVNGRACAHQSTGMRLSDQGTVSRMGCFVCGFVTHAVLVPARDARELEILCDAARGAIRSGDAKEWALGTIHAGDREWMAIHVGAPSAVVASLARRVKASWTLDVEEMRHASVHRVVLGPPARFVATCHRTGGLKWFRVENVSDAKLDAHEKFREADPKVVDAHLRASLDGFHEGGPPAKHVFFVSDPDARWVARNLMEAMQAEEVPGGIRVTVETSALTRLARFVVGLGAAAKPLTPGLEAEVTGLARGALEAIGAKE